MSDAAAHRAAVFSIRPPPGGSGRVTPVLAHDPHPAVVGTGCARHLDTVLTEMGLTGSDLQGLTAEADPRTLCRSPRGTVTPARSSTSRNEERTSSGQTTGATPGEEYRSFSLTGGVI